MELTYTADANGILYPDLLPLPAPKEDIGRWGRKRLNYLKEHRPILYTCMKTDGPLYEHLIEINHQAEDRLYDMVPKMAKAQGIDEALKSRNQMGWVGAMNNIRHSAEEIINAELVYS